MSVEVVVTGIGLVSALGMLESTWKEILSGHSGIRLQQPFRELERRPLALIGKKPVELIKLTQQVLADAIIDADLFLPLPDCGLVIGSSRGNQAKLEQFAREGRRKKEEEGELPITNYQLPITNYQLPITNYQLPITNYQLPITNYQLPITNYQLPITNYQLPITNYQLPITNYQLPILRFSA